MEDQGEMPMKEFTGKVAVITGGASGIGLGLAEKCIRLGMKIVVADIEDSALSHAQTKLRALGGEVVCVTTDVSKREDVELLARQAFEIFGGVHLLFNNAGVAAGGAPWEATWNDWEWVVGVNLWGVIHGVKAFTPLMLAQNTQCHIINTASAAGLIAGGFSAPYSVTKHAVVALSENLYLALQQRNAAIRVSVLCPGLVQTNITEAERNRPAELQNEPLPPHPEREAGQAALKAMIATGMRPESVADLVFDAIENEKFYILTHPEWMDVVRLRTRCLLRTQNPQNPAQVVARIIRPASS
jgi:NAD(P)-dependent dehydrogenase (short-subunit alcohol dehydrogenase family)